MSNALLETARSLVKNNTGRPRQADLKRCISTAYYALFHAFAQNAADCLVGTGPDTPGKAWAHVYRALDHGTAKKACGELRRRGFPVSICEAAEAFVTLQQNRHAADYDPYHGVTKSDAIEAINLASVAIEKLNNADRKHRIDLAVQLLLKKRP